MSAISTIRNLGPKTEAAFARAGITTAEQIIELGTDDAYARLIATGTKPHFLGFCALVMGMQNRRWSDPDEHEKHRLRQRFDRIVSARHDPAQSRIEAELRKLGLSDPDR